MGRSSKALNVLVLIIGFVQSGCSEVTFVSLAETTALTKTVFVRPPQVAGVNAASGLPSENLRVTSVTEAAQSFVKDCSQPVTLPDGTTESRYDWEREQALVAAESDPDQKTVPVEFAISFGSIEDQLAVWAHQRAILSENNPGYSVIPVGDKKSASGPRGPGAYYRANHTQAKSNYIRGERCFFDTVRLESDLIEGPGRYYDFITAAEKDATLIHKIHYMYFGYCAGAKCAKNTSPYGAGLYGDDTYPNRLFAPWPHEENERPQIVKLYVADLRNGHFGVAKDGKDIISVQTGTVRGTEVRVDLMKQLDIESVYRNTQKVIRNLSSDYQSKATGNIFAGMEGAPQLLHNLLVEGLDGTALPSQYTPIVLDLGLPGIRTSSTFGGTLFNMSATKKAGAAGPEDEYDVPELTSWLGGELLDVQDEAKKEDGLQFPVDIRRIADDGFLALPDADGQIRSSRNLFGDNTVVDGKTFANGFLALQAYAKKDCESTDLKKKYLGPWDRAYQELRIWVDQDRNGLVGQGELRTLEAAGVAALNTCNTLHSEEKDEYGNGTAMRSAFLESDGQTLTEDEILRRLETGKTSQGAVASFRVAIDIVFQVKSATPVRSLSGVSP